MIIDAHQHFWQYDPQRDTWITPEMSVLKRDYLPGDLRSEFAANGVDGSIAVQASQSEQETLFLLALADQYKEVAGVVGWVDLRDKRVRDRLAYLFQFHKLRGFRHIVQSEPDNRFMLRDDFCRGISFLHEFKFTYDILIYPKQLPTAIELVKRFPEQRFVVDHMAKPVIRHGEFQPWADHISKLAAEPNVWCKLSGLVTEAEWGRWRPEQFRPYFDLVLSAFGAERLMFGSDWPVCMLSGSYAQIKALVLNAISGLNPDQQKRIMGLNAISFYGLETSQHGFAA